MPNSSTPRPANSPSDAQGQQQEYRDGDGVGPVKGATAARQGFFGGRIVIVMAVSIGLAIVAFLILRAVYFTGATTGQ